ncbi:unnamed protein product [Ixodes pacificus]
MWSSSMGGNSSMSSSPGVFRPTVLGRPCSLPGGPLRFAEGRGSLTASSESSLESALPAASSSDELDELEESLWLRYGTRLTLESDRGPHDDTTACWALPPSGPHWPSPFTTWSTRKLTTSTASAIPSTASAISSTVSATLSSTASATLSSMASATLSSTASATPSSTASATLSSAASATLSSTAPTTTSTPSSCCKRGAVSCCGLSVAAATSSTLSCVVWPSIAYRRHGFPTLTIRLGDRGHLKSLASHDVLGIRRPQPRAR